MRFDPNFLPGEVILSRTHKPSWKASDRTHATSWKLWKVATGMISGALTKTLETSTEFYSDTWHTNQVSIEIGNIHARFAEEDTGIETYRSLVALEQLQEGIDAMIRKSTEDLVADISAVKVQDISNIARTFALRGTGGFYDSAEEKYLSETRDSFDLLLVSAALDIPREIAPLDDIPF